MTGTCGGRKSDGPLVDGRPHYVTRLRLRRGLAGPSSPRRGASIPLGVGGPQRVMHEPAPADRARYTRIEQLAGTDTPDPHHGLHHKPPVQHGAPRVGPPGADGANGWGHPAAVGARRGRTGAAARRGAAVGRGRGGARAQVGRPLRWCRAPRHQLLHEVHARRDPVVRPDPHCRDAVC